MQSPWPPPSSASSSRTAIAPIARRPGSNTCSTNGALPKVRRRSRKATPVQTHAASCLRNASRVREVAKHRPHRRFIRRRQHGLSYVGVVLPVGRMTDRPDAAAWPYLRQPRRGTIRLTVWQNLLISRHPEGKDRAGQTRAGRTLGLTWSATGMRGGLVACTGNAGCKFAAANTKTPRHGDRGLSRPAVELPHGINIHFTGCPNSCAQHYLGDIGLLGAKVAVGEGRWSRVTTSSLAAATEPTSTLAVRSIANVVADDVPRRSRTCCKAILQHWTRPGGDLPRFRHSALNRAIEGNVRSAGGRLSVMPQWFPRSRKALRFRRPSVRG